MFVLIRLTFSVPCVCCFPPSERTRNDEDGLFSADVYVEQTHFQKYEYFGQSQFRMDEFCGYMHVLDVCILEIDTFLG